MNEKTVPYYVHEMMVARMERIIKMLVIIVLVEFLAFVGTNVFWIVRENQYKDEEYVYEIEQDSGDGGTITYTGNTVRFGGDYNGEAED